MKVIRPGEKLDIVADNDLGEPCYASPAISQGQIFIRGEAFVVRRKIISPSSYFRFLSQCARK
jgi:hypothetical protein